MSDDRAFERAVDDWLADGSNQTRQPVVDAVLLAVKSTPQERDLRIPWRTPPMSVPLRLAAGVVIVAVVGLAGLNLLGPGPGPGSTSSPTPSPTPSSTPSPSPTRAAEATPPPIDTAGWTTYASSQYGFSIGHPADWTEDPASRAWTFEADASESLNTAQENFHSADGHVRVSAWSVALAPGTTVEAWSDVEAWVDAYCQQAKTGPCTGIHDRVVPLCNEKWDCHPALLVPFENDVQAFFTGGNYDEMVVVAVWWGESEPAVAPYGGSRRLLEAFLSTMGVLPADVSPWYGNRDAAATFLRTGQTQ